MNLKKKLHEFNAGDLVRLIINDNINITSEGFALGGTCRDNGYLEIFEKINLETYPSCNDFLGNSIFAKDGDLAIIIRKVGRPLRLIDDPTWFKYDVYEVITERNFIGHVFRQNIKLIRI